MMPSLQTIQWRRGSESVVLLVAAEPWLSAGLRALLASTGLDAGTDQQPGTLVVKRGALQLIADEQVRTANTLLLIDPEDHERLRAVSLNAGNHRSRIITIPSPAAIGAAEQAMLLMLALSRKLLPDYSAVVGGSWHRPQHGPALAGKTLGIVGLGRSGQALAERALGFGMRVIFDDSAEKEEVAARLPVFKRRFDQVLREADVVSLHLPANPETFRLIDAPELAAMKPTALLINVADGRLIDEGSLVKALRNEDISGAGLDAFAYEPLAMDSPLLGFENVILTPRTAWMSPDEEQRVWLNRLTEILTAE